MGIFKSASKIVFIAFAITICAAYLLGLLPTDDFVKLAMMPFVFYFANKGEAQEPFAGK